MRVGLGIDAIEIERFAQWHTYPHQSLRRIFTSEEIAHCLQEPQHAAQRFATRFAMREAFFKAIQSAYPDRLMPFLSVCKAVSLSASLNRAPLLRIDQEKMIKLTKDSMSHTLVSSISITHTQSTATVSVLIIGNSF